MANSNIPAALWRAANDTDCMADLQKSCATLVKKYTPVQTPPSDLGNATTTFGNADQEIFDRSIPTALWLGQAVPACGKALEADATALVATYKAANPPLPRNLGTAATKWANDQSYTYTDPGAEG